ncbi:BRO-N domain-containing protein [Lelliottia wanjuensis]|uniref:BRO-N domain-containing protein n=1 Tax=Lelliottia wanjuensis TaxID=3050585 RepID=UPI002549D196|nr:BRO family protein [Lelliottia sp. V86_10]MDK9583189.1 BRO family protein [Lelliottia sp. V86_10]
MTQRKSAPLPERRFERGGRANETTSANPIPAGGAAQPGADVQTFEFRSGTGAMLANVRAVLLDGAPWFYAVDVCDALELKDTNKSLLGVDDEDRREHEYYSGSGRKPLLVNESGLYSLIFKSRKSAARQFKRWVTSEVLPSIRSTGGYAGVAPVPAIDFADPAAAARAWADEYEAKKQITGYAQRQAKYIDHLENLFTDGLTPVQFCRRLNGVNTSRVNSWLMEKNWLYDDTPNAHRATWRVFSYARDQYLTETSRTIKPNKHTSFEAFSAVLLKKGAVWLYRHYLKGDLPMKTDWSGEYTHDKELAELVGGRAVNS